MVIDKKDFQLLWEEKRSFLQDQVYRFEDEVADLILSGNHRDERCTDLIVIGADHFGIREVVHVPDDEADGRKSHC